MNRTVLTLSLVTVALIGACYGLLERVRSRQQLGRPAVRITNVPLLGEDGRITRTNSVFLPGLVNGYEAKPAPVSDKELSFLPPDTSFGRLCYRSVQDDFKIQASVVLMGRDRTSIHQPDFCLTGAGWQIQSKRHETIPVLGVSGAGLPVRRFDALLNYSTPEGRPQRIAGVYVFWFIADGRVTSSQFSRTWWLMRDLLSRGVLQRWAYVSYFATCSPGSEDETYDRLVKLIQESAPQFQRLELAAAP